MKTQTPHPILILADLLQGNPYHPNPNLDPLWQTIFQTISQSPPQERSQAFTNLVPTLSSADLDHLYDLALAQYLHFSGILLTTRHVQLLAFLLRSGPATLAQITDAIRQPGSNTHNRLATLAKKGYLERFYQNDRIHYQITIQTDE